MHKSLIGIEHFSTRLEYCNRTATLNKVENDVYFFNHPLGESKPIIGTVRNKGKFLLTIHIFC